MKEEFSIFLNGAYMTYINEILNPFIKKHQFKFLNCNITSIHYILNRTISHLLIERFIKWLEVVLVSKKYEHVYPDDNIPLFITKIPENKNEGIIFYFPLKTSNYMKGIIQKISEQYSCPFQKSKKYPPYRDPIRIMLNNM
jgi:hypothetical protein